MTGWFTSGRAWLAGVMLSSVGVTARAQELSAAVGAMSTPDTSQSTYAWQLEYRRNFARNFAWSAMWLNEGHVTGHHRDGVATQLWLRQSRMAGLSIALGCGAYYFCDTQAQPKGDSLDSHRWAPVGSLSLTHYTTSRWFWRATINTIRPADGIAGTSVTLGTGYSLDAELVTMHGVKPPHVTANELTAFTGRTVVNATVGKETQAGSIEYRRGMGRYVDGTISWLQEGDTGVTHRRGLGSQVWLVDHYFERRLAIGLGFGPYFFYDAKRGAATGDDSRYDLAGLVSPSVSYRCGKSWLLRLTWNRVLTDYDRDADGFLLGVGYRWGN
jgi:hypothetical protein